MAQIEFSPAHRPVLPIGDYSIEIKPGLKVDGSDKNGEIPTVVPQSFVISGERFALQSADVVAVFPPDGSIGDHSNVLPHLILQRSTLPWERAADPADPKASTLPWLALLVFDETAGEIPVTSTLTLSQLQTPQPGQLTADGAGVQGPAGIFPTVLANTNTSAVSAGKIKLETGQNLEDKTTVIDVKASVLARMMPNRADLAWMAHVRQSVDGPERGEEKAVLIANRMPVRGGRSIVHLVSFENQFGPNGFYTPLSLTAPDTQLVRLVSLKSWSFTCTEAYKVSPTFVATLQQTITIDAAKADALNQIGEVTGTEAFLTQIKAVLGEQVITANKDLILRSATHETFLGLLQHIDRSPSTLRLPKPNNLPEAAEKMLATGAAALPHRFRNGDKLVSWYHGPLVPAIPNVSLQGRPDLVPASFASVPSWINLLKTPGADALATWLSGKLSADTKTAIAPLSAANDQVAVKVLLRDLNHILTTEALYAPSRFSKPLPADLQAAVAQGRTGETLFQLNRKLLEFAYPQQVSAAKFQFPISTSDEVLVYNATTGMFDVSYAAAWQLGRLMALRDKKFSLELFSWKRSMAQNLKSAEQQAFAHLPFSTTSISDTSAAFPKTLQQWFDKLGILENIPFNYLVPDEKMLPAESIRFFKMTPFWMDCLMDGAFSIGRTGTAEQAFDAVHLENADLQPDQDISGFLLRSDLISGWPDLQVKAYNQEVPDDGDPAASIITLNPIVARRLSPGIMLWLFKGTIHTVDIYQKPEMLHFGFDQTGDNIYEKPLRKNDGTRLLVNGKSVVVSVTNQPNKPIYWRDTTQYRCLNMDVLANQIKAALVAQGEAVATYTAAEFALQMIEGATRVRFRGN